MVAVIAKNEAIQFPEKKAWIATSNHAETVILLAMTGKNHFLFFR